MHEREKRANQQLKRENIVPAWRRTIEDFGCRNKSQYGLRIITEGDLHLPWTLVAPEHWWWGRRTSICPPPPTRSPSICPHFYTPDIGICGILFVVHLEIYFAPAVDHLHYPIDERFQMRDFSLYLSVAFLGIEATRDCVIFVMYSFIYIYIQAKHKMEVLIVWTPQQNLFSH